MKRRFDDRRVSAGATYGVLAFATFIITVGLSMILNNDWFNFFDMALSNLGQLGEYTYIFRIGMILTGLFMAGFGFGLEEYLDKKAKIAAKGVILASIGLIFIGVFPDGFPHIFSVCFMFSAIAIALIALSLKYDDWEYANMAGIILAISLASVFAFMFVTGYALSETIVFFAVGILVLAYAWRMHKDTKGGISWEHLQFNLIKR